MLLILGFDTIPISMSISEDILSDKRYIKQIEKISDKSLKLVAEDPIRALKEAHKGVKKVEPERANDLEYLQAQADAMQSFAKSLLAKRAKKKSPKK